MQTIHLMLINVSNDDDDDNDEDDDNDNDNDVDDDESYCPWLTYEGKQALERIQLRTIIFIFLNMLTYIGILFCQMSQKKVPYFWKSIL